MFFVFGHRVGCFCSYAEPVFTEAFLSRQTTTDRVARFSQVPPSRKPFYGPQYVDVPRETLVSGSTR